MILITANVDWFSHTLIIPTHITAMDTLVLINLDVGGRVSENCLLCLPSSSINQHGGLWPSRGPHMADLTVILMVLCHPLALSRDTSCKLQLKFWDTVSGGRKSVNNIVSRLYPLNIVGTYIYPVDLKLFHTIMEPGWVFYPWDVHIGTLYRSFIPCSPPMKPCQYYMTFPDVLGRTWKYCLNLSTLLFFLQC